MTPRISGFDPLESKLPFQELVSTTSGVFEDAIKGTVNNILKSYTGFFDLFSETIQNALDATEKKFNSVSRSDKYAPQIWISVDIRNNLIKVVDNGCGMQIDEFLLCFRPNISFKKGQNLRGNKGVGATFLAYGFNFINLQTKVDEQSHSAILRQGRQWAEDLSGRLPRPTLEESEFNCPELENEDTGTSVEIRLTGSSTERPRVLDWHGATKADQWFDILRIVTPLGGIYLKTPPYKVTAHVIVIDRSGQRTVFNSKTAEFYYPHEIPSLKTADVTEIKRHIDALEGDPKTRSHKLPDKFKNLDLIYDVWDHKGLLSHDYLKLSLDEVETGLIEQYQVSVYGAHVDSVETFNSLNENLGLRNSTKIIQGGLQLASDFMPQGELIQIPLKRFIGYQRNTLIIVHFKHGNPDMGRKTFQPELKNVAERLAERITHLFINYRWLLKPDTGSTKNLTPDRELHGWKKRQETWRDQNPIPNQAISGGFTYLAPAQEEQDVIAIYHQLIGCGVIRGIFFFSNEYNEKYDALIELNYSDDSYLFSENNILGVRRDYPLAEASHPMVLEYKFDFDAILRDIEVFVKFAEHIDVVVCWKASGQYHEKLILKSLLVDKEGSSRIAFGTTHLAYLPGEYTRPVFEVCILEELINFLTNPDKELANQRVKYKVK